MSESGLTATDVALYTGISPRAVRKRSGIEQFQIGTRLERGRPEIVFDEAVLALWGIDPATLADRKRRIRCDRGRPRICSPEHWAAIVQTVQGLYMANAQPNLRLACEEAARQMEVRLGIGLPLTHVQIYKRLTRRNSEFYRDGWELVRQSGLRKKDVALSLATSRYDWLSIFEDLGWAGRGFGALRGWAIDVRKNDIWTASTGRGELVAAIYIRCALTGWMLWVEPVVTETSEAIIRAYLKCVLAWQKCPDLFIAIDNGQAMIAERTIGVLSSTLPDTAFRRAEEFPEVFGRRGSPILHNLPNIPKAPFKAALERSFKLIQDEYDAPHHPTHYQGGNRSEAVQIRVSNRPSWHYTRQSLVTAESYFGDLDRFLRAEYITRSRPRMFPLLVERGITPSIESAFEYYYNDEPSLPHGERLALLLYWATEKRSTARASLGYVDVTINGQYWHCVTARLDHRSVGRKITVLPVPNSEYAILVDSEDPGNPQYIDTVANGFIRSKSRLVEVRARVVEVQNDIRAKLHAEREATPAARWGSAEPVAPQRALPDGVAAWIDGEPIYVEDVAAIDEVDAAMDDIDDIINA